MLFHPPPAIAHHRGEEVMRETLQLFYGGRKHDPPHLPPSRPCVLMKC